MRVSKFMVLLLTVVGLSSPCTATSATPTDPVPAPSSAAPATVQTNSMDDSNRMVCKYYESTGSRLHGSKICHTVQEWNAIRHLSEMQVDKSSNAAAVAKIPPSSH
jgi:hypothetical protein